ncbi:MAG: hypothetical protein H0T51_11705 [Pirellulales bacterium]|nr:hypothetical protein [Pirellulales bacterium]
MPPSKSSKAKAAWDRARRYAEEHGVSIKEARSTLARQKDAPEVAAPKTKPRSNKLKSSSKVVDLGVAERELRRKYPHIVEGSIRVHDNGPHKGRRTVEIVCQNKGCQNKRRIHTSDAFQVELCNACTKIVRQRRRAKASKKTK